MTAANSPDSARSNRLARESSPYLLLHAKNPVDWYPWGPEALERARREDKPIFLSVGYSTCFWCHVMERESFSDPSVAALMNDEFVNVKVDREERLDLDEIYMLATQVLAGQGGWPNSVFLTPDLKPFFAGTYFPPLDQQGMPGFPTVLRSMIHAWKERRDDVEAQGEELAEAIRRHLAEIEPYAGPLPGPEPAIRALATLRQRFDGTWGGFGGAPKFPTPSNLFHLLWATGEGAASLPEGEADAAAMMLAATLDGLGRGGIHDALAGGFHRYATDREWKVPHFEKMLYDNGLLLEAFARDFERSGRPESARVARAVAGFLADEMTSPDGAFWSAIDAETGGREGASYVWTRDELELALGREEATFLAPVFGFDGEPFFEGDRYVLHLPRPIDVLARERRTTREALLAEVEPLREKLHRVRARRRRPATDDKILADWNGIAIAGLAVAGRALGEAALVERAARAATFVLATLRAEDGTLLHAWRAGRGHVAAGLSDYAFLVRGLLRLHEATHDGRWLAEARRLADEQEARLRSPKGGYFNAADAPDLLVRGKEIFDGALPSGNGIAAQNLLDLHAATGEREYRERAEATIRAFAPLVDRHPEGARTMSVAIARFGPAEAGAGPAPATRGAPAAESAPVAIGGAAAALRREALAAVRAEAFDDGEPDAGAEGRRIRIRLAIADGWHVDADTLRFAGSGVTLEDPTSPEPELLPSPPPEPARAIRRGTVEFGARAVRFPAPGSRPAIEVTFQACDERRCLPPVTLSLALP